ncbi:MFS transporter [Roseisolibacter agri]|uniref:Tetracycline resistance MFS efflux pump n=1 Tax=Roseisolibacter agri TaxID=2014610 RepID=A0AA37QHM3_9BACT|nr:MFS transporter [Roseisolibacter agri]GLC27003.1 tetracycline resistance MFS efflux pump [Roseisolibacter agri]
MSDRQEGGAGVGKLVALMFTAFLDMVGLLMVIPLIPFYAQHLGGNGIDVALGSIRYHLGIGQITALLVSAYTVAQLLSAPLWGRFSDRYGRRPALVVALTASAVAYIIFGYATSLVVLFLSRVVQGAGGGTVGVIQAYVADVARPDDRAKSLGWLSAATNAGVALGPVLGSWMQGAGKAAPGLLAAALCLVNILFVWRFLRESREVERTATGSHKAIVPRQRSHQAVARVLTHPGEPASRLISIYAIAIGAFQGVTSILALFLAARYGVTERTIGYFFMYIGIISVVTRAAILGKLVDRLGEARLARLGLTLMAIGLAALPLTNGYPTLAAAVALMPLGTAFTFPCVTAMLSRVTPKEERGLYMGVQQTFGGASRAIFPIIAGLAFDKLGVGVPFFIAAALVALTLLLGADLERYAKRESAAPA